MRFGSTPIGSVCGANSPAARRGLPVVARADAEAELGPAQYRFSVRLLHKWLKHRGRALEDLDRRELADWLKHLYDRGQAPATRVNVIVAVRVYLRVLEENGVLRHPADELIRRTDFPKLPAYLPRPLPPSADDVVCRRLARSRDRLQQAFPRWVQSRAVNDPEARHRAEILGLRLKRIRQDLAGLQPVGGSSDPE